MAEFEDWTPADDDELRSALSVLTRETDRLPLPDVAFVKARGEQRRRRTALTWGGAAAAAAAAVAVAVTLGSLGPDRAVQPVPATSGTPTLSQPAPSPSYRGHLDVAGALPVALEWRESLGVSGPFAAAQVPYAGLECGDPGPPAPAGAQGLTGSATPVQGGQYLWTLDSADRAEKLAAAIASGITACAGPNAGRITVTPLTGAYAYPRTWSFTADGASGGFYILARAGRDVSVLTVNPESGRTLGVDATGVAALAAVAQRRLERYGSPQVTTATTAVTRGTGPTSGTLRGTGQAGAGEGPTRVLTSVGTPIPESLFLTPSQWAEAGVGAGGTLVSRIPDAVEGWALTLCDPLSEGGNVGRAWVQVKGTATPIGVQRVQPSNVMSNGTTNETEPAAIIRGFTADAQCRSGKDPEVKVTPGPSTNTVAVSTRYQGGSGWSTDYVGVVAMKGTTNTTTIALLSRPDATTDQAATWRQVDALMAAAAQR